MKTTLKTYVRIDGNRQLIPGTVVHKRTKPKLGNWIEMLNYDCCDFSSTTTTTTSYVSLTLGCYGLIYNYYVVENISPIYASNSHIPSNTEWQSLFTYLGASAGGRLKTIDFWTSPNTGAVNDIGFNSLPAGSRFYTVGIFAGINISAAFLSTGLSGSNVWYAPLQYGASTASLGLNNKKSGYSIRLIVDSPNYYIDGSNAVYIGNDDKHYPCKLINEIWWTTQNLIETKYRDGSNVALITDNTAWTLLTTGAYCYYNNDSSINCPTTSTTTTIPPTTTSTSSSTTTTTTTTGAPIFNTLFIHFPILT